MAQATALIKLAAAHEVNGTLVEHSRGKKNNASQPFNGGSPSESENKRKISPRLDFQHLLNRGLGFLTLYLQD